MITSRTATRRFNDFLAGLDGIYTVTSYYRLSDHLSWVLIIMDKITKQWGIGVFYAKDRTIEPMFYATAIEAQKAFVAYCSEDIKQAESNVANAFIPLV